MAPELYFIDPGRSPCGCRSPSLPNRRPFITAKLVSHRTLEAGRDPAAGSGTGQRFEQRESRALPEIKEIVINAGFQHQRSNPPGDADRWRSKGLYISCGVEHSSSFSFGRIEYCETSRLLARLRPQGTGHAHRPGAGRAQLMRRCCSKTWDWYARRHRGIALGAGLLGR